MLLVGVEGDALQHAGGAHALVRRVGAGEFRERVRVVGPRDLAAFGAQLGGKARHPACHAGCDGGVELVGGAAGEEVRLGWVDLLGEGPDGVQVLLGVGQFPFQVVEFGLLGVEFGDDVLFEAQLPDAFVGVEWGEGARVGAVDDAPGVATRDGSEPALVGRAFREEVALGAVEFVQDAEEECAIEAGVVGIQGAGAAGLLLEDGGGLGGAVSDRDGDVGGAGAVGFGDGAVRLPVDAERAAGVEGPAGAAQPGCQAPLQPVEEVGVLLGTGEDVFAWFRVPARDVVAEAVVALDVRQRVVDGEHVEVVGLEHGEGEQAGAERGEERLAGAGGFGPGRLGGEVVAVAGLGGGGAGGVRVQVGDGAVLGVEVVALDDPRHHAASRTPHHEPAVGDEWEVADLAGDVVLLTLAQSFGELPLQVDAEPFGLVAPDLGALEGQRLGWLVVLGQ